MEDVRLTNLNPGDTKVSQATTDASALAEIREINDNPVATVLKEVSRQKSDGGTEVLEFETTTADSDSLRTANGIKIRDIDIDIPQEAKDMLAQQSSAVTEQGGGKRKRKKTRRKKKKTKKRGGRRKKKSRKKKKKSRKKRLR